MIRYLPLLAAALAAPAAAQEPPRFAGIFTDHAVLQRDQPLTVWGRAKAGETVTVSLAGKEARARVDRQGRWRATLPPLPAGGPHTLTATTSGGTATIADVKLGDVYLCSGQSNMEFPVRLSTNAWALPNTMPDPDLRFVTIAQDSQPVPLADLAKPAAWRTIDKDSIGDASAVCYYMARSLRQSEAVPIGMVHSSWGGTTIQSWISPAALARTPRYTQDLRTIALLGSDRAAAYDSQARREEAWWRANDPGFAAQRGWSAAALDDSGWTTITDPGAWAAGPADLAAHSGAVWLRTTVDLTPEQARGDVRLQLGPVDKFDTAWINGRWVGSGAIHWSWRDYPIPASVLKPGRNTVALRVLGKGLTGQPAVRGLRLADGNLAPLGSTWRYRLGSRLADVTPPTSPWTVPTSLSTLYNGMIAPLRGYGFKLAAWYQGESNAGEAGSYRALLTTMMADWRRELDKPALPFMIAQLTAFGAPSTQAGPSGWAELRQAQAEAVAADRNAALVVTLDLGDRFDIHPTQKTVIGDRMARAARALAYGKPVDPRAPTATRVRRAGADLEVDIASTGGGLRTYSADTAIGFETCAGDVCRYQPATVRGETVVLPGANRPEVTRVRYAWADTPFINLFGAADEPVAPFVLPVGQ